MVDHYLRQSPLAHLGLAARTDGERPGGERPGGERTVAGIVMSELRHRGIVTLRGKADDAGFAAAAKKALGFALPTAACTSAGKGEVTALWQGPDEWWIVTADDGGEMADRLRKALDGQHAAITEVGESRCCIRVAGPHARDLLAKGCPLDLHPRVFGAGRCAGSLLAKAGVTLHQVSDGATDDAGGPAFDIYVLRSFADYLWRWLEDAAQEYGMVVTDS